MTNLSFSEDMMSIKGNIDLCFGSKDTEDFDLTLMRNVPDRVRKCDRHWHDCFEIMSVYTGRCEVNIGGSSFMLEAGDIAVIPPRLVHSTYNEPDWGFTGLVYGYTESVIYSPDLSISNLKYLSPFRSYRPVGEYILRGGMDCTARVRKILDRGAEIFESRDVLRAIRMRANILELHAELYSLYSFSNLPEKAFGHLLEAQKYIEAQLPNEISPYEVAREIHISYSHLSRIIKSELDMTVSELIMSMRIDLAERLFIEDHDINVTECALRVGFGDTSYFIKRFKQLKSISPGEYIKLIRRSDT